MANNFDDSGQTLCSVVEAELVVDYQPTWLHLCVLPGLCLAFIIFAIENTGQTVLYLHALPHGAGIRPMGWPVQIVLFGIGSIVFAIGNVVMTFQATNQVPIGFRTRTLPRVLSLAAILTCVVPLLITTFGMHWVIQERELWLKP